MKRLTIPQTFLLFILTLAGIFIITTAVKESAAATPAEAEVSNNTLTISHDSGFYTENVDLMIAGENLAEVYYTLDGSIPSSENPSAMIYADDLFLFCEETETIYTLRFRAYYMDDTCSEVINRTYIVGDNVDTRYDMPVLSIAAPSEIFWNDEDGILRLDNNNRFRIRGWDSERQVLMTLFDADGNVCLSQNCGFRLYGAASRARNQASFRLYARSEYDTQNDFEYTFFDNQFSENNTLISDYKRIIARNSGCDNGYAFIRSELATRLCIDAGYPDSPCASPVVVYLAGDYYGTFWFITNYDDSYFRNTYGDYEGTMYTFEGKMHQLSYDDDEADETVITLTNYYNQKISYFSTCDLNTNDNWIELNNFMDVENFLQYMAIHNYLGNRDILFNNYKIYRYIAPDDTSYTEGSVFDGKYRFLLFDLDGTFGFTGIDTIVSSVEDFSTTTLLNSSEGYNRFFINLMKRDDCQDYYIRYMLALQNYYFSYEYANPILDEMHESRASELYYTITNSSLLKDNPGAPNITSLEEVEAQLDVIRDFLKYRKIYIAEDLSASFGSLTTYDLYLDNACNANITLDHVTINDNFFTGLYYQEVPLTLSAKAKPGYRFDYWLVNGERVNSPSLEIVAPMITESRVSLECICSPDPDAEVCITAIKSNVGNDYIKLTNIGTKTRYLSRYYLTDNNAQNKSPLPAISLASGETITIYCKDYSSIDAVGKPYVNVDLQAGETLSLYLSNNTPLQSITIPSPGTEEGIYSMNMKTGIFSEIIPQ